MYYRNQNLNGVLILITLVSLVALLVSIGLGAWRCALISLIVGFCALWVYRHIP